MNGDRRQADTVVRQPLHGWLLMSLRGGARHVVCRQRMVGVAFYAGCRRAAVMKVGAGGMA